MSRQRALRPAQSVLLALSSAALLVISFPSFNQPWCAWIALVPWLFLLRRVHGRVAFWWSWGIGALFFLGSIWWLIHVTMFGWLMLSAFLALYFGFFGWFVSRSNTYHSSLITHHLFIASAWVALEYARTHLLSGFGWNLLGYSQTPWIQMIQLADITGVWGVSFLIVFVNSLIAGAVTVAGDAKRGRAAAGPATVIAGVVMLMAVGYGEWRRSQFVEGPSASIAVVQGNIPQSEKWDDAYRMSIQQRYAALSEAAAKTKPDLIVWPETSVPGYFNTDEDLTQWVFGIAKRLQRPLLVGAPVPTFHEGSVFLVNSAVLVGPQGDALKRYDKLRLVPFGEFIPFEVWLPWIRQLLPPIGDFSPGHEPTVFHLSPITHHPSLKFSVLICFEDIFPELARRFVREGAQLLLVITNDGWFGPTAAAYQHAQASTFRAVELRVPVARAANTGWSGCIDQAGRWVDSVRDASGAELFVSGFQTCALPVREAYTLYRRFGDWFAFLCLLVVGIISFLYGKRPSRKSSRKA